MAVKVAGVYICDTLRLEPGILEMLSVFDEQRKKDPFKYNSVLTFSLLKANNYFFE